MITRLFSPFDPTTLKFQLNWISIFSVLIILPINFWISKSRVNKIKTNIENKIKEEFINITHHKEIILLSISTFIIIAINNLIGLFPYVFTSTRHLSISISIAIPIWIILIIYGWINHTNSIFIHLLPTGTPYMIIPIIIIIETTGNLIRPISLSVRLTANIIAGHLLMTLIGNLSDTRTLILTFPAKIILTIFESAISIIQAYVFSTLITLYSREIPYEKKSSIPLSNKKTLTNFNIYKYLNYIIRNSNMITKKRNNKYNNRINTDNFMFIMLMTRCSTRIYISR